jgi:alpha-glucosidase
MSAPGALRSARLVEGDFGSGAVFDFGSARLECFFPASDLVRISWEPGRAPLPFALAKTRWPGCRVELRAEGAGMRLEGPEASVVVGANGGLDFLCGHGRLLRRDLPPIRSGGGWTLRSQLRREESMHGLGLRAAGLDLRPGDYRMWNRDPGGSYGPGADPLYLCVPVLFCRHAQGSCLLFFENPHPGAFSLHRTPNESRIRFERGMLRYFLVPGPVDRALERYTELTGRPPLPPRWALGFHQSRWGYAGQKEIREVARGFERHGLPLAAVHLDIDHLRGYRVFTVNRRRFPDLKGLSAELGARGVCLAGIVDPGVKREPGYWVYDEGRRRDAFCRRPDGSDQVGRVWPGECVFPDFTAERTRQWWGGLYRQMLDRGIEGVWHDMNEPAAFVSSGDPSLPQDTRHDMQGRGGDHLEAHNLYGLLMARAGYEGLRRERPERRPWLLTRSGWAGVQRYAWHWTGDTESTWAALRQTVHSALNLGLSGIAFTGPDIGGFSGSPSRELFLRWLQLAAFLPFFRNHCAWDRPRREPWRFGAEALRIARRYLKLRTRLMPYLYTLAREASISGHPLVRPLFWHFPDDPAARGEQDSFLLGDRLLVAPVLEPEAGSREVRLPAGRWYDFWDGAVYEGPGGTSLPASLSRIPVLVREASVLPLQEGERLDLHLHAPAGTGEPEMAGELYSDAGDGYGPGRLDRFAMARDELGVRVEWTSEGEYPFPFASVRAVVHGLRPGAARADGARVGRRARTIRTGRFCLLRIEEAGR